MIHFVQQTPDEFTLNDCHVPSLQALVPWSEKRLGSVPAQLTAWLKAVRQQLASATAFKPLPPSNWLRPAEVTCNCQYCTQLNTFLASPASEVGRIPAKEESRRHLIDSINKHRCDITHKLEKTGSPYSLVLKKTTGSYERALKRFETDCSLQSALPPSR